MTIAEWLFNAMRKLKEAGVDAPRRDAFVIVEDTLEKDRIWVNAHGEQELSDQQTTKLDQLIERRVAREPLAYLRGKAWFYGRFFEVNPSVMIPRPESEAFIGLLKQVNDRSDQGQSFQVVDVGTGSGCLGITAKLEIPQARVRAIDFSQKALNVARRNTQKHNADIELQHSSLLESLPSSSLYDSTIIMANLPYVPRNIITSPEITHEPPEALFSGKDGLDHYREFWRHILRFEFKPEYILTESLENQHRNLTSFAQKAGYKLEKTDVLVQLFART